MKLKNITFILAILLIAAVALGSVSAVDDIADDGLAVDDTVDAVEAIDDSDVLADC